MKMKTKLHGIYFLNIDTCYVSQVESLGSSIVHVPCTYYILGVVETLPVMWVDDH
jgi:hypothetical protein